MEDGLSDLNVSRRCANNLHFVSCAVPVEKIAGNVAKGLKGCLGKGEGAEGMPSNSGNETRICSGK